jgi:hypothetical protein
VARLLRDRGRTAWALRGGVAGWIHAGLPTETRTVEAKRAAEGICPDCGLPLAQHTPNT